MLRRRFGRGSDTSAEPTPTDAPQRARGTLGRMKRAKPPNVIGRGPLLDAAGFGVAIVSIVKDEAAYLEEWLAYHVALGVDHFFIYDNGSTDGSARLLEPYQNHGLVTRIDWPLGGGQLAAYNHSLRFFGGTADWLAYYDVDEFLVPLADDDIPSFLARFTDAADVRVPRKEFGFSGQRTPPAALTIDAYTQVADVLDRDPSLPARVKSIVRPAAISAVDIHLAFPADAPTPGVPTETAETSVAGIAQLNHYYTRSFEEFEAKRFRGSATGRIDRPAVPFDLPTIEVDTSAQRFSARTQASIDRLRRLEARPYTYGSQLRLGWFPRPNDLGRFAEFALANTSAGLPEPARAAAARVRNLYDGVGLVADLADSGLEPSRGALAGSVHTAALVEHMRGRIDWSLTEAGAPSTQRGSLTTPDDGPMRLVTDGGEADLVIDLPASEALRCWYLGFMVSAESGLRLSASVERADGTTSEPVRIDLSASRCLAGIVEIEPAPVAARSLRLHVESSAGAADTAEAIDVHDLFAISTG